MRIFIELILIYTNPLTLSNHLLFLVSGRDLPCQQEVSLALTKTPPIHYYI